MQRAKTQRKRGVAALPAAGGMGDSPFTGDTIVKATEDSLEAFFACESAANFNQPWQKLDRGSRLDRLRKFVTAYPGSLTAAERAALLSTVLKAFELRQLNTKVAVDYDPTTATITAIRGLRERVTISGLRTFRIDPPAAGRARTTLKRKGVTAAGGAGSDGTTLTTTALDTTVE
jgi:hypothetical protein